MIWNCDGPGAWSCDDYTAIRGSGGTAPWTLRHGDQPLYTNVDSLTECKQIAQKREDKLNAVDPRQYPVTTVTKVEVIDNRPTAMFRGKAFSAKDVERAVLSFLDNNETLKVVLS